MSMNIFQKITMNDRAYITGLLYDSDNLCCEFSFANHILWDSEGALRFAVAEDTLVYRMENRESVRYFIPSFRGRCRELLRFLDRDADGRPYQLGCMTASMRDELLACTEEGAYAISSNRDNCDYIYSVDALAELRGKKLQKKKNHLNQFLRNYEDHSYEELTPANLEECRQMKALWFAHREAAGMSSDSLRYESSIIDLALDRYTEFEFEGGLVRVNGEVKAFTIGERLGRNAFVTHFEKGMEDIIGIYAFMNQQFAANTLQGKYRFVNREEDLGLPGLRQAKLSYRPEMLYEKYTAEKQL